MDFPIFLNKFIIGNKYLRHTSFWFWWRLISHEDYRLDDRFLYQDFWNSINEGQTQMVEDDKWMTYFGAKPEKIILSQEDFNALTEVINKPPQYNENLAKLLNCKEPWDE